MKKECVEDYNQISVIDIDLLGSNKRLDKFEKNIKLEYAREGEIESNGFLLKLTETSCNFGGWRLWFVCRSCNKRVGTLFYSMYDSEPHCRNCLNLTYQDRQRKRELFFEVFRLQRKANKIKQKGLRKGIHKRTYFKHILEYEGLVERIRETLLFIKG